MACVRTSHKWLQTASNVFDLLYTGDGGGIAVTAARAEAFVSTS
jgi:hypothetical protein